MTTIEWAAFFVVGILVVTFLVGVLEAPIREDMDDHEKKLIASMRERDAA